MTMTMSFYDNLKFNADGLIPAIVQDQASGRVLMMAWMNRASLENHHRRPAGRISGAARVKKILDEGRDQRAHADGQRHRVRL